MLLYAGCRAQQLIFGKRLPLSIRTFNSDIWIAATRRLTLSRHKAEFQG